MHKSFPAITGSGLKVFLAALAWGVFILFIFDGGDIVASALFCYSVHSIATFGLINDNIKSLRERIALFTLLAFFAGYKLFMYGEARTEVERDIKELCTKHKITEACELHELHFHASDNDIGNYSY